MSEEEHEDQSIMEMTLDDILGFIIVIGIGVFIAFPLAHWWWEAFMGV